MAELSVNIGNLPLKNPVMTASGTFGYGIEYADFMDISRLGGIFVKGTTCRSILPSISTRKSRILIRI